MTWITPGAINYIGKLPVRAGAGAFECGNLSDIDTLVCHYLGDTGSQGTVAGFGDVAPEATAVYQTTKTEGDLFPEIAYTWQVSCDGTLYQFHDVAKITWHAQVWNTRSRGVLLTGFGLLGKPNATQVATLSKLWKDLASHLSRPIQLLPHKATCITSCPGKAADIWIAEAKQMSVVTEPTVLPGFEARSSFEWYCPATGFSITHRVLQLYQKRDGFYWLGYPRSAWTREGGVLVQWFQRGRIQVKPQYTQADGNVDPSVPWYEVFEIGLVGDEVLRGRGLIT